MIQWKVVKPAFLIASQKTVSSIGYGLPHTHTVISQDHTNMKMFKSFVEEKYLIFNSLENE